MRSSQKESCVSTVLTRHKMEDTRRFGREMLLKRLCIIITIIIIRRRVETNGSLRNDVIKIVFEMESALTIGVSSCMKFDCMISGTWRWL